MLNRYSLPVSSLVSVAGCFPHPHKKKFGQSDNHIPCINELCYCIKTISVTLHLMGHKETTNELALCMLSVHKTVNDL